MALIESKSELHRNDFKKIVLGDLGNESGLKPSVTNLRLKDLLTHSVLTEALRAKMSRSKETLELEVQGQAKLAHQSNASRRLAETVQSVGEQLKANAGPKTELTTKQIDQQLNLSLKAKDGMSM